GDEGERRHGGAERDDLPAAEAFAVRLDRALHDAPLAHAVLVDAALVVRGVERAIEDRVELHRVRCRHLRHARRGDELDVEPLVAPGGMRCPIDKMKPGYESKTGNMLKATIGAGGATHKQVVQGVAVDVPVVQPPYKDVIDSGNVVTSSETPLATVAIVVVVKKGDPKPDISSADAVKRMLLAAKSISYPDGAGGQGGARGVRFEATQLSRRLFTPTL